MNMPPPASRDELKAWLEILTDPDVQVVMGYGSDGPVVYIATTDNLSYREWVEGGFAGSVLAYLLGSS